MNRPKDMPTARLAISSPNAARRAKQKKAGHSDQVPFDPSPDPLPSGKVRDEGPGATPRLLAQLQGTPNSRTPATTVCQKSSKWIDFLSTLMKIIEFS